MKFKFVFILLIFTISLLAKEVTPLQAKKIATVFFKHSSSRVARATKVVPLYYENKIYFFVVQFGKGFVLVAADDRVFPILAYSNENSYDFKEQKNISQEIWLNNLKGLFDKLQKNQKLARHQAWQEILSGDFFKNKKSGSFLIKTSWKQSFPYNYQLPKTAQDKLVLTGTGVISLAQILKYYQYPSKIATKLDYLWDMDDNDSQTNLKLELNDSSKINWELMRTQYESINQQGFEEVSKLILKLALLLKTDFGYSYSSTEFVRIINALISELGYSRKLEFISKSNKSEKVWNELLATEIEEKRPILLAINQLEKNTSTYLTLVDGISYDAFYHVNWGWGSNNGFYYMNQFCEQDLKSKELYEAIINISPNRDHNKCLISYPYNGSVVSLGSVAEVKVHSVLMRDRNPKVDLFIDQQLIYSSTGNPYIFLWNTTEFKEGEHQIKALAYENGKVVAGDSIFIQLSAWEMRSSGFKTPDRGIRGFDFVNEKIAWAWAYDGSGKEGAVQDYIITKDGGNSWESGKIENASNYTISNISSYNEKIAWAALFNDGKSSRYGGKVMYTADGGKSWSFQESAKFTKNGFLNFVHMFDRQEGLCVGDPESGHFVIYRTENGGETWQKVASRSLETNNLIMEGEVGYTGLFASYGDILWFGTNRGRIYKSKDRGKSWKVYDSGLGDIDNLVFKDENYGIVINEVNGKVRMRYTDNGGLSWNDLNYRGKVYAGDISFIKGTSATFISVSSQSENSGSSISVDNGLSWRELDNDYQYTCLGFYDGNHGFAGGYNINEFYGGLFNWIATDFTDSKLEDEGRDLDIVTYYKNNPDPFNPIAIIYFEIKEQANINLTLYDLMGREIKNLVNGKIKAGSHQVGFSTSDLKNGIYFYKLSVGDGTVLTRKIILY